MDVMRCESEEMEKGGAERVRTPVSRSSSQGTGVGSNERGFMRPELGAQS